LIAARKKKRVSLPKNSCPVSAFLGFPTKMSGNLGAFDQVAKRAMETLPAFQPHAGGYAKKNPGSRERNSQSA
jgi:hypothetical protein